MTWACKILYSYLYVIKSSKTIENNGNVKCFSVERLTCNTENNAWLSYWISKYLLTLLAI